MTGLLLAWSDGDEGALDRLLPIVQGELRRLARRHMRRERDGHTLQTTALVNEVFVRLLDTSRVRWQNRAHFFALSARLMRRVLVDHARARRYQKRGGDAVHVTFDEELAVSPGSSPDLVALDDALTRLAASDTRKARVVELRFFGGLSVAETAEVLGVSVETIARDWRMAKTWLYRELSHDA